MANNTNYVISLSGINSKDKSEVGIPALELAELLNANVPIPSGFIVTQHALEHFALTTQLDQKVKQLQHIGSFSETTLTKLILEAEIPKEIYDDLSREYTSLSGISNIWMRLRAGLYDANGNPLTFIDDKEINEVKGFDALELELKKIWAKLLIIDQKYDSLGSFVIIQKLVPAEVSGVILTQDITAKESNNIIIKSMYGEISDDFISSFDSYVFSKQDEKIVSREINPQQKMLVRSSKSDFGYEEVEISDKWQMKQKLSDKYIEDLGYLGDYLENVFTKPQEVTWVFQAGKIWINYVKPITEKYFGLNNETVLEKDIEKDIEELSPIIEKEVEKYEEDEIEINLEETKEIGKPAQEQLNKQQEENVDLINDVVVPDITLQEAEVIPDIDINLRANAIATDVLVAGIGNNKGIFHGKVVFDRDACTDKDILVLSEWDDMPKHAAGVIIEDIINVSSEIPLVYGAELASKILREGEFIKIDTDTGFIFESEGESKEEMIPQVQETLADKLEDLEDDIFIDNTEQLKKEDYAEEIIVKIPEPVSVPQVEVIPVTLPEINLANPPKKKIVKKKKIIETVIEKEEPLDENMPTAIKVIAHVSNHTKETIKYADGYLLELPHASDYMSGNENVDYKSLNNLIYNFTLPFAANPKNILIYNIFDVNPSIYLKNSDLLLVQCEAIHKLRSKENLRHLHVALPKFKNLKQLREFRKSVSAAGLRRSTTFKVYIKIAYSSNIFELPAYLEDRFDGVIVNVDTLHNSLYSADRKMVKITSTLITALQQIQKDCKAAKVPMILDLKGVKITKQVLERLNPFINYSISVLPRYTEITKRHIVNLERQRIFK